MCKRFIYLFLVFVFCLARPLTAQLTDVTSPGDTIIDWPRGSSQSTSNTGEHAIDNDLTTKFFSWNGDTEPTGLDVTPSIGRTIVTGLKIGSAWDVPARDPIQFELWGSNVSIDGPYTLIASGDVDDFNQTTEWPRNTLTETPITFANNKGYDHYRLMLYPIRGPVTTDGGGGNGLQLGEIELLGFPGSGTEASNPKPAKGATDVPRDVVTSWTPAEFANTHDVYFGDVFEDVNTAGAGSPLLVSPAQDANTYSPSRLEFGTTYYWRIDEVNAPPNPTIFKGEVWSFTVEPVGYPIPAENITAAASSYMQDNEPNKTVDGSGLVDDLHMIDTKTMWLSETSEPGAAWIQYDFDKLYKLHQMLVWNYNGSSILIGFSLKDVTIEYSEDGQTWTVLPDANEFAQAPGTNGYQYDTTVDFNGAVAQSVKITANSNWGGTMFAQYGLSEVRFLYIPVNAREPNPNSGATDVDVDDVTLSFRAGREAAEHNVYLSTDEQAVIDGTAPVATVTDAGYSPSESLILDSTYYWRVDEVNNAETPATWQGDIWSLSTQESLVVDDFEDYNDYQPDEIWSTWVDGYGDSSNGATAGYPEPLDFLAGEHYMETTIVHGGKQSAPFLYDNTTVDADYSEISVNPGDLAVGSDWTVGSPETLVLWFYGDSDNAATEQMYVKVNDVKVLYSGDATDITRPIWKQWNVDLTALGIDLSNVTRMTIGFERTDGVGGSGMVLIDDILLYHSAPPIPLEEVWIEAEDADTIGALIQVIDDPATSGGKYITVDPGNNSTGAPDLPDGVATWTFTVTGGTYKIRIRLTTEFDDDNYDSCWFRIQGAEINRNIHSSGWIRHNDSRPRGGTWGWDDLHSSEDDANQAVHFTLEPGTHTLEWAYREDGLWVDAFVVSRAF